MAERNYPNWMPQWARRADRWMSTPIGNSSVSRGEVIFGLMNPQMFLMQQGAEGLGRGLSNLFRRSQSGQPLPSWMARGYPGADALNAGPPRPAYTLPDFSGLMPPSQGPNDLYGQGQGMMRAPSAPVMPTRGVGTRGGEVVARGQAAQNFVGGLRDSMNQQNLQNQARNAMENMFRGSER